MSKSPTARSMELMRSRGYLCAVVEHWNQWAGIRQDLFGFIDILALGEGGDIVGVQATSRSNVAARIKKITEHDNVARVRRAGIRILVHGWGQGSDGKWAVREVDVS